MEVTTRRKFKSLLVCTGHPVRVKSAIHASDFLNDDSSDDVLLIDADNAFNRVNRVVCQ